MIITEIIQCVFIAILIIMIFVIGGLAYEKSLHQDFTCINLVYQFKNDLKEILVAFISSRKNRQSFDLLFWDEMRALVKEYSHPQFETVVTTGYFDNEKVPFLCVQFKPKSTLSDEECGEIANLILLKFRQYLYSYMLGWRNFIYYSIGKDFIRFFVYYEEFPEDKDGFERKYKIHLRQNENNLCGLIEDEQLTKELCHVDQTGMVAEGLGTGD